MTNAHTPPPPDGTTGGQRFAWQLTDVFGLDQRGSGETLAHCIVLGFEAAERLLTTGGGAVHATLTIHGRSLLIAPDVDDDVEVSLKRTLEGLDWFFRSLMFAHYC